MGIDVSWRVPRDIAVRINTEIRDSFEYGSALGFVEKVPHPMGYHQVSVTFNFEGPPVEAEPEDGSTIMPGTPQGICNTATPCDVCAAVLDAFSAADDDESLSRDFKSAMAYTSCGKTERLFGNFERENYKPEAMSCLVKKRKSLMGIYSSLMHWTSPEKAYADARTGIVMVRKIYKDRAVGVGRALSDCIDLEVIRRWRDTCDSQHKGNCSSHLMGLPPIHLPWLIDTYDQCIVSGPSVQRYVALSYVWGASGKAQLTTRTLQELRKKGSLRKGPPTPRTIMDAMVLCQKIGERYLWADTLCIPQDDNLVRAHMISNMTAVYANATMTIIAADGAHADHGLRGVPGQSQLPREPLQLMAGPLGFQVFRKPMKSLDDTTWNTRGWTFQEYAFSPRRLIFIQDTVRWECSQSCCWEEIEQPGEALRMTSDSLTDSMRRRDKLKEVFYDSDVSDIRRAQILPLPPYPNLLLLGRLVSAYSQRDLSFDHDAPAAFAGVLTALKTTFLGGFVWGIPAMFFDIALTWSSTTAAKVANLRPRSSSCPEDVIPPRWTWMSWQGCFLEETWDSSQYIFSESEDYWRTWTIPITTWYIQAHKTAEPRPIHLQNEWYVYRKLYMGVVDNNFLPPGWTAHKVTLSGSSSGEPVPDTPTDAGLGHTSATVVYTHERLGKTRFWHPIPLNEPSTRTISPASDILLRANSDRRYLVCKAEQTQLYTAYMTGGALGHPIAKVPITQKDSKEVICKMTPDNTTHLGIGGDCVTVVAVSGGYVASYPAAPDRESIEHYNVLCVSWEDGVAYRRGVGRIPRTVWESLDRETVDLVLA